MIKSVLNILRFTSCDVITCCIGSCDMCKSNV